MFAKTRTSELKEVILLMRPVYNEHGKKICCCDVSTRAVEIVGRGCGTRVCFGDNGQLHVEYYRP